MSVCRIIDSAPGIDTALKPVSLRSVWPEGKKREKKFPEKWSVAKLSKIKAQPLMLLNGKILYIYLFYFEQALRIVSNKK